jgi:hypothetical protein
MVDEINSQNTWRQITPPGRVKKVKPRPDFNRDKRSNQKGHKGGYGKDKKSGKPQDTSLPNGEDPEDGKKRAAADSGNRNTDKQKGRNGRSHGKLIDIVV